MLVGKKISKINKRAALLFGTIEYVKKETTFSIRFSLHMSVTKDSKVQYSGTFSFSHIMTNNKENVNYLCRLQEIGSQQ